MNNPNPNTRPEPGQDDDALNVLAVFDRLEIGPVQLELNRLIAPYRLIRGDAHQSIDLIYRYDETVFDPVDPASQNLANMIAVQVALNYGLFCKELVFHGSFDEADRRFIHDMARHTAREIYVVKFLMDNPFLRGEAASLPALRRDSYLRAEIRFADTHLPSKRERESFGWPSEAGKHAILSSGGKDSLLSYGLLKEIGYEPHSLFVNESGRHWYTALNAFRHLSESDPNTGRIWTNCDRVFSWMLRQFPFVRQDFAQVRSDEYPIRLWTVAVFLFGALPLMRKRGIGRVLIGDEFDTTARGSFKGITHYNGLYDQSRYFDEAMTRYFSRKHWSLCQFSILRPLSELLIQKTLSERYPSLQQHQTSCHATHIENQRVLPCGKCEKCRRIVGMLISINADYRGCGYSDAQADRCLKDLASLGVHQEAPGARQLGFLLKSRGLISGSGLGKFPAVEHPEIMKLRFDSERSPMDGIPLDLREPLYRIFLEHAQGSVHRTGTVWQDFDILKDAGLRKPYAFEAPEAKAREPDVDRPDGYILGELTWPEAEARFKQVDIALLPVGAIEQHGPHLPLDTDAFDAEYLAREVAAACKDPKPLVLPLIPYGVSYHHEDFKGTISVRNETLAHLVYDVGMSAARNGIAKLVIINGHGGNLATLQFAAQMINRDAHIFTCVDTGETSDADIDRHAETPHDVHAGEIETSTSLAIRPHLVKMDRASTFVPKFSSPYLNFGFEKGVEWYVRTAKISETGVLGDPSKASKEKGERIWKIMIDNLVEFIEHLKNSTLGEIYRHRH